MGIKFELFKNSNVILFYTHQGLGDSISCSPIANYIGKLFTSKKILFIVQSKRYGEMISKLISQRNVEIYVPEEWEDGKKTDSFGSHLEYFTELSDRNNWDLIFTGGKYYRNYSSLPWDYSFYECLGLNYETKYNHFHIDKTALENKESFEKITQNKEYIFVHDDTKRGRKIKPHNENNYLVVKNDISYSLFDYIQIVKKAKECHIMGSSLLCLMDFFELNFENCSYYLYDFRGSNVNFKGKEKWIQVK
tara:strand:- start:6200 stop:6946 length:747 start_codon:yes stop_codon:yes gene_type:complete